MNGTESSFETRRTAHEMVRHGWCPSHLEVWLDKLAQQTNYCPATHRHPSGIGFTIVDATLSDDEDMPTLILTLQHRLPAGTRPLQGRLAQAAHAGASRSGLLSSSATRRPTSLSAGVEVSATSPPEVRNALLDWESCFFQAGNAFPAVRPPQYDSDLPLADNTETNPFCNILPSIGGDPGTEDDPSGDAMHYQANSLCWSLSDCPSCTRNQWTLKLHVGEGPRGQTARNFQNGRITRLSLAGGDEEALSA